MKIAINLPFSLKRMKAESAYILAKQIASLEDSERILNLNATICGMVAIFGT